MSPWNHFYILQNGVRQPYVIAVTIRPVCAMRSQKQIILWHNEQQSFTNISLSHSSSKTSYSKYINRTLIPASRILCSDAEGPIFFTLNAWTISSDLYQCSNDVLCCVHTHSDSSFDCIRPHVRQNHTFRGHHQGVVFGKGFGCRDV